ncbi:hypothetical protein FD723_41200 (plasmid) [Nostoc sp. C052]|uniref:hypothetical protein n=1 Tax=Nostoc sp. C052 TaxID=2576902 RepID=UPI0015C31083|nr:hypothetical protein [Nostoc sp. C052]QLE46626.1 hypothetical protein FD723_41200 [Nostoc sp. C052]
MVAKLVIALHTSIGIASCQPSEIALVHLGFFTDGFGMKISKQISEIVEQVIDVYLRLDFNRAITKLLSTQVFRLTLLRGIL